MFFAALCTVYIRYRWLRLVSNEERSLRCCNIMALVLGGLSALGLSLVANFQVTIKNIFFYYLLKVQLFSKSNVNTDYLNEHNLKKSNYGKLKYIELNNVLQETNLEGVHMTGAAMTIGCGILYMFSQTALSYKMADTISISRLRLILAVVCSLTAASCILHVNQRDKICFKSPNRQEHY